MLELVVMHNISITKFRDLDFRKHLNIDHVAYETFINVLIELTHVVEEKIMEEMKDNKGCILHDGWSRYGRHYVALMASYLIKQKTGELEVDKAVISLLACSTLPHDDDESKCVSRASSLFLFMGYDLTCPMFYIQIPMQLRLPSMPMSMSITSRRLSTTFPLIRFLTLPWPRLLTVPT